jgi:hypothetical protein
MIFLLHHTNNKNSKSIKDNGLWATPVCNTHDPTEWFDFVFNYDTQTDNKEKIEKTFKDKFTKSLFWINFSWFDIDVDINKETYMIEVRYRLIKEGDKTGSHIYVNLINFYQDKTVGADINSSILIDKDKFDLSVKQVIAKNGFKCIASKITYDEKLTDKVPKVTVSIETLSDGRILFESEPEIEPSALLAFRKRKTGKNGEWYFGEKEFRYLFHRLDDIMCADLNLEHIDIPIQSSALIEIPRQKFAGIVCNLMNGSIKKSRTLELKTYCCPNLFYCQKWRRNPPNALPVPKSGLSPAKYFTWSFRLSD